MMLAGAALAVATPAAAQSLTDTLRAFRSTVGQLTGKRPATATPAAHSDPATAAADPLDAMLAGEPDSALAAMPVRPRDASTFDVAGYKLGMSPREAVRIARARKVRANMTLNAGTWEAQARTKANLSLSDDLKVRGRTLSNYNGVAPDGSTSQVSFIATPQGTQVSSLYYVTPSQGQTPDAILQAMIARYGPPTRRDPIYNGVVATWCGVDRECANEIHSTNDYLKATITTTDTTMFLHRSGKFHRAMTTALDAYAAKLAGQNAKPVAF
ncbi:MAG: hypothetical protein V4537_16580 [Pseudomonadota bacterium]